jgi:hypothetical protein
MKRNAGKCTAAREASRSGRLRVALILTVGVGSCGIGFGSSTLTLENHERERVMTSSVNCHCIVGREKCEEHVVEFEALLRSSAAD